MSRKGKVLTWNIRHGGTKSKIDAIIEALILHEPDVMVITEYRENENDAKIRSVLLSNGWTYIHSSNPPGNENGILVASKVPFESVTSSDLPQAAHRWLEIRLPAYDLTLVGIHIPGIKDKWGKKDHWETLVRYAKSHPDERVLVIGDFNTGLAIDTEGAPLQLAEYMEELICMGWADAWRVHHSRIRDFTWYSNTGNGFRLDYAFLSPALASELLVAYHSHRERVSKLSDHSMLIVEFMTHQ